MTEKIIDSDKRVEKANNRRDTALDFIKEIREVFYDMESTFIMRKDLKNISIDKMDELLNKYNDFLAKLFLRHII